MNIDVNNIRAIYPSRNMDIVKITFEITRYCNFNCSYCSQSKNKELIKPDLNELKLRIDNLIWYLDMYQNDREVQLSLLGGELMIFDIDKILDYLLPKISNLTKVTITSNFSANVVKYISIVNKLTNKYKVLIILSYHDEYFSPEKFMAKFMKIPSSLRHHFKIEAVINEDIYHKVYKLSQICKLTNVTYTIDLDRSKESLSNRCIELANNTPAAKKYICELTNGTKYLLNKAEVISLNPTPKFPGYLNTSNFICCNEHNKLKVVLYEIYDSCRYAGDDMQICKLGRCNMCSDSIKLVKKDDQ